MFNEVSLKYFPDTHVRLKGSVEEIVSPAVGDMY